MTTLVLQPAEATAVDTYNQSSLPTTNFGTSAVIQTRGDNPRLGLIRFDLSTIPVGATVTGATLSLWLSSANVVTGTQQALHVYPMTQTGWTEAGSTWNKYDGTSAWTGSAGGQSDHGASIGSVLVTFAILGQYDVPLAVPAVQSKVGGPLDLGLQNPTTSGDALMLWRSSSDGTASLRPRLVVEYTEPATGGPLLLAQNRHWYGA